MTDVSHVIKDKSSGVENENADIRRLSVVDISSSFRYKSFRNTFKVNFVSKVSWRKKSTSVALLNFCTTVSLTSLNFTYPVVSR